MNTKFKLIIFGTSFLGINGAIWPIMESNFNFFNLLLEDVNWYQWNKFKGWRSRDLKDYQIKLNLPKEKHKGLNAPPIP